MIAPAGAPDIVVSAPAPELALKRRAMLASAWTLGGYVVSYGLRFFSSVLVTHLIPRGPLGLMNGIVGPALDGLGMITDLGLAQSVIQNKRGDESVFRNTAWTMQVFIQGLGLTAVAMALAWPLATFYHEPQIGPMLAVAALSLLVSGLASTSLATLVRHFGMRTVMVLETAAKLLELVVIVAIAFYTESVWAVIAGLIAREALKTVVSHVIARPPRNRLAWEPEAARAIWLFGRWILLGSVVTWVSTRLDRPILLKLVGNERLQVYSVAANLSLLVFDVTTQLTYRILLPLFSRVARETPERLSEVFYRARLRLDAVGMLGSGFVGAAAPWIISFLYSDEYAEGKWFLRLLSIRSGMACMLVPAENVLFSMGHTWYNFARSLARAIWIVAGIPIGWKLGGMNGVLVVVVASEFPVLLVLWPGLIKHRIFRITGELRAVAVFALGLLLGWLFLMAATRLVPDLRLGPILHSIKDHLHLSRPA